MTKMVGLIFSSTIQITVKKANHLFFTESAVILSVS